MSQAATEEEKLEIYLAEGRDYSAEALAEKNELRAKFGGELRLVLAAFEERGMIDEVQRKRLIEVADSRTWMGEAVEELEALAKRL